MNLKAVFIAISSSLLLTPGISAQELPAVLDSARAISFSDPEAAIRLYERAAFFSNEDSVVSYCREQAAGICFRRGEYALAGKYYRQLSALCDDDSLRKHFLLSYGLCCLLTGEYEQVWNALDTNTFPVTEPDLFFYKATLYNGFAYELSSQYEKAGACFRMLYPLLNEQDSATLARLNRSMLRSSVKNPRTALVMSLMLPGAGQLYANAYGEAINSFAVNGFFITISVFTGLTYTLADGMLTGYMTVPRYYLGGARKAGELARKRNKQKAKALFEKHRKFFQAAEMNLNR